MKAFAKASWAVPPTTPTLLPGKRSARGRTGCLRSRLHGEAGGNLK